MSGIVKSNAVRFTGIAAVHSSPDSATLIDTERVMAFSAT